MCIRCERLAAERSVISLVCAFQMTRQNPGNGSSVNTTRQRASRHNRWPPSSSQNRHPVVIVLLESATLRSKPRRDVIAQTPESPPSNENALDAAAVGLGHVIGHPVGPEKMLRDLDHDVIG